MQSPRDEDGPHVPEETPDARSTTESDRAVQEAHDSTLDLRRTGITGYVLVSLSVRRDGTVESAVAIMPKLEGEFRVHAIDGKTGAELLPPPPHTLQPDFCRAAEKAALSQRFRPATLLGRPVRYRDHRIGFSFDAPVEAEGHG